MNKVATLNEIVRFSKVSKNKGKKVGLVVGSFDIVHLGPSTYFVLLRNM